MIRLVCVFGILALALSGSGPAYAKPLKVCLKPFKKSVRACNDEDGKALGKCAKKKYDALYDCLDDDAEYKEERGEKKFKKAYQGFYKRINDALTTCLRYTDDEKDDCLNGTYKASFRDLNKITKKYFEKRKRKDDDTDVDKEVGDCAGALKKKAMDCNEKEGSKIYKCLKKRYDTFYKCVVKDVKFKDEKKDRKKSDAMYNNLYERVEDAVKICQRYTRKKMKKCLTATHKVAIKDFQKNLNKLMED